MADPTQAIRAHCTTFQLPAVRPVCVPPRCVQVACGSHHVVAVTSCGRAFSWGCEGGEGRLGSQVGKCAPRMEPSGGRKLYRCLHCHHGSGAVSTADRIRACVATSPQLVAIPAEYHVTAVVAGSTFSAALTTPRRSRSEPDTADDAVRVRTAPSGGAGCGAGVGAGAGVADAACLSGDSGSRSKARSTPTASVVFVWGDGQYGQLGLPEFRPAAAASGSSACVPKVSDRYSHVCRPTRLPIVGNPTQLAAGVFIHWCALGVWRCD